jgi:hypothetical protein
MSFAGGQAEVARLPPEVALLPKVEVAVTQCDVRC